ncbi:hypothetical protein DB346_20885 [Verrucomicrobia bacterium LW23]|nr:hypothetical protein DB346_20885 [Verrucomicrobia bacterium LW23]
MTVTYMMLIREESITSASYSQSVRTGALTEAALQLIGSEIRQEIALGSDAVTPLGGYGEPAQLVYLPRNEWLSQPAVVATGDEKARLPNVLRRSGRRAFLQTNAPVAARYPFASQPFTLVASDVSTTTPSANNRAMARDRWNAPAMMAGTNLSSFSAPDWIMMTRGGPLVFSSPTAAAGLDGTEVTPRPADPSPANTTLVTGRFAFTMYRTDYGLDVGAVGAPASGLPAAVAARRRTLPFANLDRVPGFSASLQQKLLDFRNTSTAATVYNAAAPADPGTFFGWATRTSHGFLRPAAGDQQLLTRRELLQFLESNGVDLATSSLPQMLTVFTREVNSPSYVPATGRARIQAGFPYAGQDDALNPAFARLVYPVTVTVPVDGTLSAPLQIRAGDPLVMRRFALSRLAWLTRRGPSADNGGDANGTAANIRRYFGLEWDASSHRWVYDHGDPDKILTLNELQAKMVAGQELREPDFFELLKATLNCGSLAMEGNTSTSQPNVKDESTNLDLHVLKIGANMIDQADADGYPTVIAYSNGGGFPEVYGVEDLPYINKVYHLFLRTPANLTRLNAYLLPEIFRPHYAASSAPPVDAPTRFRVVVQEGSTLSVTSQYTVNPAVRFVPDVINRRTTATSPVGTMVWGGGTSPAKTFTQADQEASAVEFEVTSAVPFTSPTMLTGDNSSSPNVQNRITNSIYSHVFGTGSENWTGPNGEVVEKVGLPFNSWNVLYLHYFTIPANTTAVHYTRYTNPVISLALQYQDGARWQTCSEWKVLSRINQSSDYGDLNGAVPPDIHFFRNRYHFMKLDPRTERLGTDMLWNGTFSSDNRTVENRSVGHPGFGVNGYFGFLYRSWFATNGIPWTPNYYFPLQRFKWGTGIDAYARWTWLQRNTDSSADANSCYYRDPDGTVRPGDGYYAPQHAGTEANKVGAPLADTANFISRPVMLNRPFESVAELGYVYRDLPWRSLDFFSARSADAALLDVFSVDESPPVRAGVVSLNTPYVQVLQSLLRVRGGALPLQEVGVTSPATPAGGLALQDAEADAFAQMFLAKTQQLPLSVRSQLVTRLAEDADMANCYAQVNSRRIKARRESFVRALGSDATAVRTWNLMVDVVVQTGRYPVGKPVSDLGADFRVEGERRVWWHLAIDRYTGKIVDQFMEPVYE